MTSSRVPAGCVVVGVDDSEDSVRAVRWAAGQALLEHRALALVHAADPGALWEPYWLDAHGIDHRDLSAMLREAASATLARARRKAQAVAPGLEVETFLVESDARVGLQDLSADAHLLVLGSRGRGPFRTAVLGSVSAAVTRHARCPVVVCRPAGPATEVVTGIVVGADGSEASRPVLEFAFGQASLTGDSLTVVHCFLDVNQPSVERHALAQRIAGLAEKYPEVRLAEELSRGLVSECLDGHAPTAGLLVIGRAAASGFDRFFHESCALAVLERADTTVAVVPESNSRKEVR